MKYKENWDETKQRFEVWWKREKTDRPLMKIVSPREKPLEPFEDIIKPDSPERFHIDVEYNIKRFRNYCKSHEFMAEAFPNLSLNIGAGSMALYLGSTPTFRWDTIWFNECVKNGWQEFGKLIYDANNSWWKKHLEIIKKARQLANNDFPICIPDIFENIDILSAMRGPQNTCFDLIDEPELIKAYIKQVDELYFQYYDPFYELVKIEDNSCCYTAFDIWGEGKIAKMQCDFSVLMSPSQFREFILPSLKQQCSKLNHSMYHLDGKDAIRHLNSLIEIDELDALQWTPGAGQPDGGSEIWYPIYDEVRKAGKSLWISIVDGNVTQWAQKAEKIVKRYGATGIYFLFPEMSKEDGLWLLEQSYSW